MKSYTNIKKKFLKDWEIRRAYEKIGPEYAVVEAIIEKRIKKGLTQVELARKMGTKQSAISRLESGAYNPSLAFLAKAAKALGARLEICLH